MEAVDGAPSPAAASDDGDALPTLARQQTLADASHPPVTVVVGTSALATPAFVKRCAEMVNTSYGYHRVSQSEIEDRLSRGDAGENANRVLHVATRGGKLVGCCSSTKQTGWCPYGCGHWGLLVVDVQAQGSGVASALVAAAEARLFEAGLVQVQIEYEYTPGDPQSERLYNWYEGSCGFSGGGPPSSYYSSFRRCRKKLGPPRKEPHGQKRQSDRPAKPEDAGQQATKCADASPDSCLGWMRTMIRTITRRLLYPPDHRSS